MPLRWMLLALACAVSAGAARAEPVRVACAISLKEAVTEVAAAYKQEGRGEVEFTFGSSGQLQSQIEYGAPVNAFISAAHPQVDDLVRSKHADAATQRVVAGNRLVLVVPAGAKSAPAGFKDLASERVRRVAVGEPRTVPAGQYAMQVLAAMKLADALKGRLVHGANVRQVLDYVERGEVDAGIVYATDAQDAGERVRVVERADPSTHDPIEYPAVVMSDSRRRKAAVDFLDYLGSEKARAILAKRGFTAPAATPSRPRE
jgi:molybdate transport system substrate-binding protein